MSARKPISIPQNSQVEDPSDFIESDLEERSEIAPAPRVHLTEEDVSLQSQNVPAEVSSNAVSAVEQEDSKKDGQGHPCHHCLGVLPTNRRQNYPWLWRPVRSPARQQPHWQPVLSLLECLGHCPACLATLLVILDCQSPPPHSLPDPRLLLGRSAGVYVC
jgi:hypothetical protein